MRLGYWVGLLVLAARAQGALLPPLPAAGNSLVSAPATNGTITLAWAAAPDATVTGYRVYFGRTNAPGLNSYVVGKATSVRLGQLTVGASYRAYVTAYDAAGVESLPSNEVRFQPTAAGAVVKIQTTIRIHTFAIETAGLPGRTNALQEATNLAGAWTDVLVFVGDGNLKGILRTNGGSKFYRTVPR